MTLGSAAEQHRATLALSADFGEAELKIASRALIRHWHPDRFGSRPEAVSEATEKAKAINVAFEFLSELLEQNGGRYSEKSVAASANRRWEGRRSEGQPTRTYQGKTYAVGFPDLTVTEVFLKSSHIVSTAYNRRERTLYIKFIGDRIYRYFDVPADVFDEFLDARSHGKFASQVIYPRFRYERC